MGSARIKAGSQGKCIPMPTPSASSMAGRDKSTSGALLGHALLVTTNQGIESSLACKGMQIWPFGDTTTSWKWHTCKFVFFILSRSCAGSIACIM